MKKVGNHKSFSRIFFSLALTLSFSLSVFSQDSTSVDVAAAPATGGNADAGKALFNANCAACHALDKVMTGPALRGVTGKYDKEFLHAWIKDNTALIASGDALAKTASEYSPIAMTPFPQLTDQDLDDLLKYMAVGDVAPVAATASAGAS